MMMMMYRNCVVFLGAFILLVVKLNASAGDADSLYRSCVSQCQTTGCTGDLCFQECENSDSNNHNLTTEEGPWYFQGSVYSQLKKWDCLGECRYHCMVKRENERTLLGYEPVKYHGKWPFRRLYGIQEPASVVFSALNLAMHFYGWLSFFKLIFHKLPVRPDKKPYYEYSSLWHIYAFLSMSSWFWSVVFHYKDITMTEHLDYSAAVALLGYSLTLAIIRSFNIRNEATRVMIAAPVLAFTTTHILYLNNYQLDYGWNMVVCVTMGVIQLLIWAIWGGLSRHPSRLKLWTVVFGGGVAMLLEIYDFPPYEGIFDAHSLWHATTIPLTYIWWSFIKDDARFRTSNLQKKSK
ncbi:post-GPI attachment to proteins factor 3-like [Impatiens glandulifera]|uniref:post-GPI attachment to proteins factor 3-like n=1 Tax=Impatiens glandulifera TaxID=253017 RepID=UPI001FB05146|nr:post-GPI attachment to proteins factor 3-like [Impatiens glandulifera]XP_047311040.1 post-GPI attachment to proteins factor 3-like [Impatiens glandulifera]